MPKALHDKLARQANKEGLKGDRKNAYVYGTLSKIEAKSGKKNSKRQMKFSSPAAQRGRATNRGMRNG